MKSDTKVSSNDILKLTWLGDEVIMKDELLEKYRGFKIRTKADELINELKKFYENWFLFRLYGGY